MLSKITKSIELYNQKILMYYQKCPKIILKEEQNIISKFFNLIQTHPTTCLYRSNDDSHFTASSLVLNSTLDKTVLTLHKKLNKWLQLGGHSDGIPFLDEVALTEAREESGLKDLNIIKFKIKNETIHSILPFDLDIHKIPESKNTPEHYHFDVRYLIISNSKKLLISEESSDLKWIKIKDIEKYSKEKSLLKMFNKFNYLKENNLLSL